MEKASVSGHKIASTEYYSTVHLSSELSLPDNWIVTTPYVLLDTWTREIRNPVHKSVSVVRVTILSSLLPHSVQMGYLKEDCRGHYSLCRPMTAADRLTDCEMD